MGGDDHTKTDLQAKPKQQVQLLEELYQGIPDESVNLTFQDLANVNSSNNTMATNERVSDQGGIISNSTKVPSPSLSTVPSLDIKKGLGASNHNHHHHEKNYSHHHHHHQEFGHRGGGESPWGRFSHASGGVPSRAGEYSMSYDGMKSGESFASRKGGLDVWQCVEIGMGDLTEGRKCMECLGLRFSQRYIERAGMAGCCGLRYPSTLKHVELNWAEKGPRRRGDRGHNNGHHRMASTRPRNPANQRSPLSIASTEASFLYDDNDCDLKSPLKKPDSASTPSPTACGVKEDFSVLTNNEEEEDVIAGIRNDFTELVASSRTGSSKSARLTYEKVEKIGSRPRHQRDHRVEEDSPRAGG
ncbi:hypothetical protein glysoja_047165 [Glycine soja]|uniref:Uncharacterized protein n=1 Tax=Glycine soja TaxID=3848 RepID=A0A0B2RHS2_GLYSO|nr:hypothetical protein glysoja_047165 [Glycine soja]